MDRRLTREQALGQQVAEVMVQRPKTLPASATVGDVRHMFENPRHLTALLVDDLGKFIGAVDRERVSDGSDDAQPAVSLARADTTIGPDADVSEALDLMDRDRTCRLAVVDEESGLLRGLLCLSSDGRSLCAG